MKASFDMMSAPRIPLSDDLESLALSCGRTPAFFVPVKKSIFDQMADYDAAYGRYMVDHLENTAAQARGFLKHLGMDERAVGIFADAFSLHDCGKILQSPALWRITQEKRERTDGEKQERPRHTILGPDVLDGTLKKLGILSTNEREENFLCLTKILMIYHHERMDGSGPHGVAVTDKALSVLTIIDHIDGKGKAKDMTASFSEMNSRHRDEFDQDILSEYASYSRAQAGFKITPPIYSGVAKMGVS
jgi:hypothetical protein